jgi:Ser/Thr protein kinase RdoA (MazF antagonist)
MQKANICHHDFHPWNIGIVGDTLKLIDLDDIEYLSDEDMKQSRDPF